VGRRTLQALCLGSQVQSCDGLFGAGLAVRKPACLQNSADGPFVSWIRYEPRTALSYREPQGPVLDGIPLADIGVDKIDYRDEQDAEIDPTRLVNLAALVNTGMMDDELRDTEFGTSVDGIRDLDYLQ